MSRAGGDNFVDLLPERSRQVADAAVSKEGPVNPRFVRPVVRCSVACDRWRIDGFGTVQRSAVSEPPPRALGEPSSLSVGGSEGSGTDQNAAVADLPQGARRARPPVHPRRARPPVHRGHWELRHRPQQ